jgi:hypothetical protein
MDEPRLVDLLARTAAFCVGAIAAIETADLIEREVRYRAVMRTFASTREVVPNVRRGSDDSRRRRAGAGIDGRDS